MFISKVIGTTISTIKDQQLEGRKLLILRQCDENGEVYGKPYVAVDTLDAGIGDVVLTAHGSGGRQTDITKNSPVDAVIMAVVDHMVVGGKVFYQKEPWSEL
jgi:microcompartment protein CcmK/EutM